MPCQIRGVGRYIAMLTIAEVSDISRFPTARHLCSWAGLTPTVRNSDQRVRLGHITRQGSPTLRWPLIEASQHAGRGRNPMRARYDRLAKRRSKQIAKVAIAREILTLAYYGLRDGEIVAWRLAPGRARSDHWRSPSDLPCPTRALYREATTCARASSCVVNDLTGAQKPSDGRPLD